MDRDRLLETWHTLLGEAEDVEPGGTIRRSADDLVALLPDTLAHVDVRASSAFAATSNTADELDALLGTSGEGAVLPVDEAARERAEGTERAGGSQFEVERELARGGMGIIYEGIQRSLERRVALKAVQRPRLNDTGRHRFIAEARVTAYLEHPNIVPVHELGRNEQGNVLLAMKLVGGRSWTRVIEHDRKTLAPEAFIERQLGILDPVCDAIAFAHSRGIVHLDLKPDNVMVGEFGEVLVMDWGTASALPGQGEAELHAPPTTSIENPVGTPVFMAPELATGEGDHIGPHTDVYLLGGILCQILTGAPPHRGESVWQVLFSAAEGRIPKEIDEAPPDLAALCRAALAAAPEDRPPSVTSFQQGLRRYLSTRQARRFSWILGLILILLAALGCVVVALVFNTIALNSAQRIRAESIAAAMDLRKSSDDLTAAARTYVTNGSTDAEKRYWQILDIRNGKAPWHDGRVQSLRRRFEALGFTPDEMALLTEAEDESNALVETEREAMNAVKGLFKDAGGAYTVEGPPDVERARQLMFSDEYRRVKTRIMRPIDAFVELMDRRTRAEVDRYTWFSYGLVGAAALLLAALATIVVRVYLHLRSQLSRDGAMADSA